MKHSLQNGFWLGQTSNFFTFNRLAMTLLFVMSVTACNKEEFYQKDYLDNPFSDDTEVTGGSNGGETSGVDGSSQGGVSSGVTSGTTNGTTGGSTTGDTTGGSTTGGTSGGVIIDPTTGGTSGGVTGGSTTGDTTGGSTTGDTTGGSTTGDTTGGATTGDTTGGSTSGGTTGGVGDCNNGHGNDEDGVDDSNPGQGHGGPNGEKDPSISEVCYVDAEESFNQSAAQTKKIDIVWVIDNSGSMADEQRALGDNFDSFIHGFLSKNVDFKMVITTTDTSGSNKGKIVSGSDSALTSAAASANSTKFYNDFMKMVKVGTRGSGYEKGLEATEGFVNKNSNWLRPDAYLAVVVLSDEEDQSAKSVEFYTDHLKNKKASDGLVKIYSIVNTTNARTGGNTIGHIRYKKASEQTAGKTSNIMDRFDDVLMEMGDAIINLLDSFALAEQPQAGSIKVYVNGVETNAYSYDSDSRSIKFHAGSLPPVGAQVKVKYKKVK